MERAYLKNAIVAGNKYKCIIHQGSCLSLLIVLLIQRLKEKNGRFTGCLKLCTWALPYKAFNPFIYILWRTLRSFPSIFLQIDCSLFTTLITHIILLTTVYFFSFTRVVVPSITHLWLILFIAKSELFWRTFPTFSAYVALKNVFFRTFEITNAETESFMFAVTR